MAVWTNRQAPNAGSLSAGASGASIVATGISTVANSLIAGWVVTSSAATVSSVTGGGNTFVVDRTASIGATGRRLTSFYCLNAANSFNSVTANLSSSVTIRALGWCEFTSRYPGSQVFLSSSLSQSAVPGTGTDAIASTAQSARIGQLVYGACVNGTTPASQNIVTGTNFTQCAYLSTENALDEFLEMTSNASQAATFTDSIGGGTDVYGVMTMLFGSQLTVQFEQRPMWVF